MKDDQTLRTALEKAAKYICRAKCGLCPIREKDFQCPGECTVATLPWQCWMIYFCRQAKEPGRQ